MRRWNGWGDEEIIYPLPEAAAEFLQAAVGRGERTPDASLPHVLATVPNSRLPPHPLIATDAEIRLRHARGQSLPDWIALRSGRLGRFPDGVAFPADDTEVAELLRLAQEAGFTLIPYGGGTSVVGHINPLMEGPPILTLDLSRLNRLLALDETSRLATFEAGVHGPEVEAQLSRRGYILGHSPQSFEFSTLGGWIATRSSGQQSYHYGRIEALFAGGHVETPLGPLDLPAHPASAAGPDLRQLILGSEGRLGVITRAVVRVRPLPEAETFLGVFFHDLEAGVEAVRAIAQGGVQVSMLRLSDATETETTLALARRAGQVRWADRGLRSLGYGGGRCLLLVGVTGTRDQVGLARRQALGTTRRYGGLPTGTVIGETWRKTRFLTPYLRNTLWDHGYALDTLETALPWAAVPATAQAVRRALGSALESLGERVLHFAHLSHVYPDGASIYTTFLFRRAADPDETLDRWQTLKATASREVVAHGGTISHQHGVGLDHAPYLQAEKGPVGMRILEAVRRELDPQGLLNPGKLLGETVP